MISFPPEILRDFNTSLNRIRAIPGISKIFVYGSWAKGSQMTGSDIDVAVFFETDAPVLLEQYRLLVRACRSQDVDIQVQAFCACELDNPCGIIEEIVRYGVEYPVTPA